MKGEGERDKERGSVGEGLSPSLPILSPPSFLARHSLLPSSSPSLSLDHAGGVSRERRVLPCSTFSLAIRDAIAPATNLP